MADTPQKSYLRDGNGPRAVSSENGRDQSRSRDRRHRDTDDREKPRSKGRESHRSSNRRKVPASHQDTRIPERSSFELDMIGQPAQCIQLGMPVETSVMINLRVPSSDRQIDASSIDTSHLFAISSLVAVTPTGEKVPAEAGCLTGQKMYDSVNPIPEEHAATLGRTQSFQTPLGYFSFPGLLIRQAGIYRIRTTLIKMGRSAEEGGTSVQAVDSDPIKVERRGDGSQLRHQRIYD